MHVVIIGGGIAGLAAAAAPRADVTLVERDPARAPRSLRRGVPQAAHQHVLLRRGRLALEALVPGLDAALLERGAVPFDAGADIAWLTPSGWAPRVATGIEVLGATRGLLEDVLRERVQALPSVQTLAGFDWTGLDIDGTPPTVRGILTREGRSGSERHLEADLVVDATGRGSRGSSFLAAARMPIPPETSVQARVAYASVAVRGAELPGGLAGAYVRSAPPTTRRGGVLLPVEEERHLLTLIGPADRPPPTDWSGVAACAETMRRPLIADALRNAEPCGPIVASRSTSNRWRHYEKAAVLPAGYLAVGDALCALNPAFQQGMTLAAVSAEALAYALRDGGPRHVARRTYRRLGPVLQHAWLIATHEETATARTNPRARLWGSYLRAVARATTTSPPLRREHLKVLHLLTPPRRLLHPRVVQRVLKLAAAPCGAVAPHASRSEGALVVTQ